MAFSKASTLTGGAVDQKPESFHSFHAAAREDPLAL